MAGSTHGRSKVGRRARRLGRTQGRLVRSRPVPEASFHGLLRRVQCCGRLIEKHIDDNGFTRYPVVLESIPLDDDQTIDRHELNVLWTYPNLNERLLLCKQLGTRVDPEKDLLFGRPPRDEYVTYVDILA